MDIRRRALTPRTFFRELREDTRAYTNSPSGQWHALTCGRVFWRAASAQYISQSCCCRSKSKRGQPRHQHRPPRCLSRIDNFTNTLSCVAEQPHTSGLALWFDIDRQRQRKNPDIPADAECRAESKRLAHFEEHERRPAASARVTAGRR